MIPRLWTCTSHPVLSVLTFPLSVLGILGLWVVAGLLRRYGDPRLALRTLYFALALTLCYAIGVAAVTIVGGVVALLGAHANPVFIAARYLWVVLTVLALALGQMFGSRHVVSETTARPVQWHARLKVVATVAGIALVLYVPYLFVDSKPRLWKLPYLGVELLFDLATPQLASDECLAFRAVDDVQITFGSLPPGAVAFQTLDRHGVDAVPGISAFLRDELSHGWPNNAGTIGLLATVAGHGDFPILHTYAARTEYQADLMLDCIHQGRWVRRTSEASYRCELSRSSQARSRYPE